jgi:restriction system protein
MPIRPPDDPLPFILDARREMGPDPRLVGGIGEWELDFWNKLPSEIRAAFLRAAAPISLSSIIIPERKVTEGILLASTSAVWAEIIMRLHMRWEYAYQIPPDKWEEIIAGAFNVAGYDEVILTPRSGDFGRDVIAIKNGVGCVKIIGSVKAYKPGNLVRHDDVRALLGVLSGEHNASKGIVTTTSDFAPKIATDPFIKPFLPTRLELINGPKLRDWLVSLHPVLKNAKKGG